MLFHFNIIVGGIPVLLHEKHWTKAVFLNKRVVTHFGIMDSSFGVFKTWFIVVLVIKWVTKLRFIIIFESSITKGWEPLIRRINVWRSKWREEIYGFGWKKVSAPAVSKLYHLYRGSLLLIFSIIGNSFVFFVKAERFLKKLVVPWWK